MVLVSENDHFTTTLPTKRMAADCLLTDEAGRLLVLCPPYKSTWDIPGGAVEAEESPRAAARREVREEIGLEVAPGKLLAVDWKARDGDFTEVVAFLFDGGALGGNQIDRIVTEPTEVSEHRFVILQDAEGLLDVELFARVTAGLAARSSGSTVYLEDGRTAHPI